MSPSQNRNAQVATTSAKEPLSLYKARFERFQPIDHVGLFILTEPNPGSGPEDGKGVLHHVVDNSINSTKARLEMAYQVMEDYIPNKTPFRLAFKHLELIGTMQHEDMLKLVSICENTPTPSCPRKTRRPPRCNEWLDNVTHDLCGQRIVHASASFVVPPEKVELVLAKNSANKTVSNEG